MPLLNFKARKKLQALAHRWHYRLLWLSAVAVFVWGCSGALHPIMTRLGPNPATMLPPPTVIDNNALQALPAVLNQLNTLAIERLRWVTLSSGLAIQISQPNKSQRMYFSAQDGSVLADAADEMYAMALARHFTGNTKDGIRESELITQFDDSYPWVNRLLPVYKIQFADARNTTAYIHAETASLASLSDSRKEIIQTLFGKFHTLGILDHYEWLRIPLILLFVGALAFSAMSGIQLIISIKRPPQTTARWWHRKLALICCVPLLFFSLSGLHHLLQTSVGAQLRGQATISPVKLPAEFSVASATATLNTLPAQNWRDISLVQNGVQLLLRLAAMPTPAAKQQQAEPIAVAGVDEHAQHDGRAREQRFNGIPQEAAVQYIDLMNGKTTAWTDEQQARYLAVNALGIDEKDIRTIAPLTHFSATYDFRNKRLPVWEVALNNNPAQLAYIDTSSNRVIETLGRSEIIEVWNFSLLHKWNLLAVAIGRPARDVFVLAVISLCLLLTVAGVVLRLKPTPNTKSENAAKKIQPELVDSAKPNSFITGKRMVVVVIAVILVLAFTQRHLIHAIEQRVATTVCQHNPNFCESVRNALLDNPQLRAFCEERKDMCKALRNWL